MSNHQERKIIEFKLISESGTSFLKYLYTHYSSIFGQTVVITPQTREPGFTKPHRENVKKIEENYLVGKFNPISTCEFKRALKLLKNCVMVDKIFVHERDPPFPPYAFVHMTLCFDDLSEIPTEGYPIHKILPDQPDYILEYEKNPMDPDVEIPDDNLNNILAEKLEPVWENIFADKIEAKMYDFASDLSSASWFSGNETNAMRRANNSRRSNFRDPVPDTATIKYSSTLQKRHSVFIEWPLIFLNVKCLQLVISRNLLHGGRIPLKLSWFENLKELEINIKLVNHASNDAINWMDDELELKVWKNLSSLKLNFVGKGKGCISLQNIFKLRRTNLEEIGIIPTYRLLVLQFTSTNIEDWYFLKCLNQVKSLNLITCTGLPNEILEQISEQCPNLECLWISQRRTKETMSIESYIIFLKKCSGLKKLKITHMLKLLRRQYQTTNEAFLQIELCTDTFKEKLILHISEIHGKDCRKLLLDEVIGPMDNLVKQMKRAVEFIDQFILAINAYKESEEATWLFRFCVELEIFFQKCAKVFNSSDHMAHDCDCIFNLSNSNLLKKCRILAKTGTLMIEKFFQTNPRFKCAELAVMMKQSDHYLHLRHLIGYEKSCESEAEKNVCVISYKILCKNVANVYHIVGM